jgi:uncharacterized protein (DUF1330 family)
MRTRYAVTLAMVAGAMVGAAAMKALHAEATPPAFAIVQEDVRNPDAFVRDYAPLATKAIEDAGGTYLTRADGRMVAIDGVPPKRGIIIAFESLDKAVAAFTSPAYRDARKIGERYAKFSIYLQEGLPLR